MLANLKSDISELLGVSQPLNAGRYLGLPYLIGRSKRAVFAYLSDRVWRKLKGGEVNICPK